ELAAQTLSAGDVASSRSRGARRTLDAARSEPATSDDDAIDREDRHRSDDGSDDAWTTRGIAVEADRATDPSSNERTADAEQDRHDDPAGIAARHEELGDGPDDEADNERDEDVHAPRKSKLHTAFRSS